MALIVAGPNVDCDTTTPPQFYWVHGDHLGTPLAMTDTPAVPASAKVVWRAKYEPFGLATVDQDPDGDTVQVTNDYRFPGQIYDYESGLHYNLMRSYEPMSGRYLEADPVGQSGSIELFGYARLDPVRYFDPDGRNPALGAISLCLSNPTCAGLAAATIGAFAYAINGTVATLNKPSAEPMAPPEPEAMAKGGKQKLDNEYNEAAARESQETGRSVCAILDDWYREARRLCDTVKAEKIKQAQKAAGCRRNSQGSNR